MITSLVFSITYEGGRKEQLAVEADRALVGSGAHCEVRLPVEDAASEHVLILARQGMVFAEARTLTPAPTVNGALFTEGRILPESRIRVGSVEFAIALTHMAESSGRARGKGGKATVRTYLLGLLAIALAYYVYMDINRGEEALDMPAEVPELWPAVANACPQQARELAEARAAELMVNADGKRERSPFHPEDGVAAVTLFRRASACFEMAGLAHEATESKEAADGLKARMVDDFRLNRLRLERALSVQDWNTAHKVIRSLLAFLQGRSGDYVNWLSNVDRRINVKFASEKGASSL